MCQVQSCHRLAAISTRTVSLRHVRFLAAWCGHTVMPCRRCQSEPDDGCVYCTSLQVSSLPSLHVRYDSSEALYLRKALLPRFAPHRAILRKSANPGEQPGPHLSLQCRLVLVVHGQHANCRQNSHNHARPASASTCANWQQALSRAATGSGVALLPVLVQLLPRWGLSQAQLHLAKSPAGPM